MRAPMGRFEPIHDAHAIEQVALGVGISQALGDAELSAVLGTAEQFKAELPGVQQLQTITIGALAAAPSPRGPTGKQFSRMRPDGSAESELRLDRNGIAFRTTAYTRWPAIWEQARKYFEVLLPMYFAGGEIASIALNYVDKFYWDGDLSQMRPDALLRGASPYVCPHVYEATNMWHSYTGAFRQAGAAIKRLVNINLDCIDEPQPAQRRSVTITTVLTDLLNQPGYAQTKASIEFFCSRATQLHADNKLILGEILTEEMCHRIGLKD